MESRSKGLPHFSCVYKKNLPSESAKCSLKLKFEKVYEIEIATEIRRPRWEEFLLQQNLILQIPCREAFTKS
jgi:hypothetical protein